jgi:hypothetical protein
MVIGLELSTQVEALSTLLSAKDAELSEFRRTGARLPKGIPVSSKFLFSSFLTPLLCFLSRISPYGDFFF